MKRCTALIICISLSCLFIQAQDVYFNEGDSIVHDEGYITFPDSLAMDSIEVADEALVITGKEFRPDSNKAILYAAIFPGLGQIYNRKYWKLPIVYGGFLGCIYAITWNSGAYNGYRDAYNSFADQRAEKSTNVVWQDYVSMWRVTSLTDAGINWRDAKAWPASDATSFSEYLKNGKDNFRRYRDLSYIVTVAVYALCIIDAYVDAELFDFDISEDLSFRVDPVVSPGTSVSPQLFGLRCSITF